MFIETIKEMLNQQSQLDFECGIEDKPDDGTSWQEIQSFRVGNQKQKNKILLMPQNQQKENSLNDLQTQIDSSIKNDFAQFDFKKKAQDPEIIAIQLDSPLIKRKLQQLRGDMDDSPLKLSLSLSLQQSEKLEQEPIQAQAANDSIGQINSFLKSFTLSYQQPDVEKTFQEIMQLFDDQTLTWNQIYKRKSPNSPAVIIKATALVEGVSCKEIYNKIYDTDARVKWDPVCADFSVIDTIDDFNDIIYYRLVTPFGVSRRDFLQKRSYRFRYPNDESIIISFKSIENSKCPPKRGIIRCETLIAGYLIFPSPDNPNDSILKICSQCDIKGIVPKFIVNTVASKAPVDWVNKMKKACKK